VGNCVRPVVGQIVFVSEVRVLSSFLLRPPTPRQTVDPGTVRLIPGLGSQFSAQNQQVLSTTLGCLWAKVESDVSGSLVHKEHYQPLKQRQHGPSSVRKVLAKYATDVPLLTFRVLVPIVYSARQRRIRATECLLLIG